MITLIFGKRGYGKTYLCRKMITELENALVLDVNNEYKELRIASNENDVYNFKKLRIVAYNTDVEENFFTVVSKLKNRIIIIDECDRYCSPSYIHPDLDTLVRYGRHKNLSMILISRRPAEIHRNITANANEIISFRMNEPRDLEYFKKIDSNFALEVQRLEKYQFAKIQL